MRMDRLERRLLQGEEMTRCAWCHLIVEAGDQVFIDRADCELAWCSTTCANEAPYRRRPAPRRHSLRLVAP